MITKYFPYERGQLVDRSVVLPASPALELWHAELCREVGVAVDNKQTFEFDAEYDTTMAVQFWDGMVYFGRLAVSRPQD